MQRYEKSERSEIRIFQLVEVGQEAVVLSMLAPCYRCARLAELPLAIGLVAEVHGSVVTLQGSALHGVSLQRTCLSGATESAARK